MFCFFWLLSDQLCCLLERNGSKTVFFVIVLLLLSLGLFGSLSLIYCVWNKQTEVDSELQSELQELQKRSELADIQNQLHSKLQGELLNELHQLQNEMKIVLQKKNEQ